MSHYEVYDGPTAPHSGAFSAESAYGSSDRHDERSAGTEVLAKVPDLDEASESPTISLCQAGGSPRGLMSGLSTRSIATTAALMLLAAVAGFMLGRSGRVESGNEPDAWRPPPPAPSAPEAPAWNGASVLGPKTPQVSSDFTVPGFASPPSATAMPAVPAGSLGTTRMPSDEVPASTPWSYPGTTNVPAGNPTQTEANRGMTLEAPAAPATDDRGTQYRSGYGSGSYSATGDPRMASRPQARALSAPPAQSQYPTTTSPSYPRTIYPQTIYPDARPQPSYPNTPSIPNSTPYPAYPNTNTSTTPR